MTNGSVRRRERVVIVHRSPHHPPFGGHAGGLSAMRYDTAIDGSKSRVPYRLRYLLKGGAGPVYDSSSVARELAAMAECGRAIRTGTHVHYLSAEHDARFLPRLAGALRCTTSGWFHDPPDQLRQHLRDRPGLVHLDLAVAIASNQLDLLAEAWSSPDQVALLHLGVDTGFFQPPPEDADPPPMVLCVGSHFRDFDIAREVFARLRAERPEVSLVVVAHPLDLAIVPKGEGITMLQQISDEALRAQYHAAAVVLQPISDSTANSTLLETMACGRAQVVSDVGGTRDYVDDDTATFVPKGDVKAHYEAVVELLDDQVRRATMQRAARERALRFDWAEIADQFDAMCDRFGLSTR